MGSLSGLPILQMKKKNEMFCEALEWQKAILSRDHQIRERVGGKKKEKKRLCFVCYKTRCWSSLCNENTQQLRRIIYNNFYTFLH